MREIDAIHKAKNAKRARYIGIAKNQFQGIMQALTHNFKRLIRVQNTIFLTGLNSSSRGKHEIRGGI